MKFDATKHMKQLVPLGEYYSKKNDDKFHPRFPRTRRQFVYLVNEAKDKSFLKAQGGVFIAGHWFVWPQACLAYAQDQADKTLKRCA